MALLLLSSLALASIFAPPTVAPPPVKGVALPKVEALDLELGGVARDPAAPQGSPDAVMTSIRGTLTLSGLRPGAKVVLLRSASRQLEEGIYCRAKIGHARFDQGTRIPSTVDAQGRATITVSVSASIEPGGSMQSDRHGPCQGWAAVSSTPASGGASSTIEIRTPTFELPQWTRYVYEDTAALAEIFDFAMHADGVSSCSGKSIGPTATFSIGAVTSGKDLAVSIRSGPGGTICRAVSPGVAMPRDLRLVDIDWKVVKSAPAGQSSKCCAGNECMARVGEHGVLLPGNLPSDDASIYQGMYPDASTRVTLGITKPKTSADEHILGFAHAWLACDATGVNDHGVKIVLESATFEGPPGLDMPR